MKPEIKHNIIIIVISLFALQLSTSNIPSWLQTPVGLFTTLFIPGWLFLRFFQWKSEIDVLEKIILAIIFSVSVPPLIFFGLFFLFRFDEVSMRLLFETFVFLEIILLIPITLLRNSKNKKNKFCSKIET